MQSYIHAELHPSLGGLIYDLGAPEQLVIATEQLRKFSGAVSKYSAAVNKSLRCQGPEL